MRATEFHFVWSKGDSFAPTITYGPVSREAALEVFDAAKELQVAASLNPREGRLRVMSDADFRELQARHPVAEAGPELVEVDTWVTGCNRWVLGGCALPAGHDGACVPVGRS
ncbi:hypothetical protein [Actinoplanes palleronii]|uniref:Uncharacterized protein n=1 Tax=Actinoplanes palleronii TaxID=113570 RepID=A0ABQ4B3X9_9ACTN|nr:hypothetical protein [Actinoplanes palleronii]GIE65368.1 hypothetical protein Apa02nite_014760 [Actinoplanes palleronii]